MYWGTDPTKQTWVIQSRKTQLPTISELDERKDFAQEEDNYSLHENEILLVFSTVPETGVKSKNSCKKDCKIGKTKRNIDVDLGISRKTKRHVSPQFPDFFPENMNAMRERDIDIKRVEYHHSCKEVWKTKDKQIVESWMQFFG